MKQLRHTYILFILLGFFLIQTCNPPTAPGITDTPPQFNPVFSSSTQGIQDFLINGQGTINAKMVFIKKLPKTSNASNQLMFIDFSEAVDTPIVHTIAAAQGAQVPVISPDGQWVVFAKSLTTSEAGAPLSSKSSAYLCKLEIGAEPHLLVADSAFEPRFMQISNKLTVLFPTKACNYAWAGAGSGSTMKIEIDVSGSTPIIGEPEILVDYAGFSGGLSTDQKFICGGGGHVGIDSIGSNGSGGDTVSIQFQQACNASISSSLIFTNTVMYLTTSGAHPVVNNGNNFATWQVIFISNIHKKVLRGYMSPTQFKVPIETSNSTFLRAKWHHCEWSNHPYFATSTLNVRRRYEDMEFSDYQERLYLVNLKDSTYLEVLRPDSLYFCVGEDNSGYYWPWLWIEIPNTFSEDNTWLNTIK